MWVTALSPCLAVWKLSVLDWQADVHWSEGQDLYLYTVVVVCKLRKQETGMLDFVKVSWKICVAGVATSRAVRSR